MKINVSRLVFGTLFLLPLAAACPARASWVLGACYYGDAPPTPPPGVSYDESPLAPNIVLKISGNVPSTLYSITVEPSQAVQWTGPGVVPSTIQFTATSHVSDAAGHSAVPSNASASSEIDWPLSTPTPQEQWYAKASAGSVDGIGNSSSAGPFQVTFLVGPTTNSAANLPTTNLALMWMSASIATWNPSSLTGVSAQSIAYFDISVN